MATMATASKDHRGRGVLPIGDEKSDRLESDARLATDVFGAFNVPMDLIEMG